MDFLTVELEAMAAGTTPSVPITCEDITRWMRLFSYTAAQAQNALEAHRAELGTNVTEAQWENVPSSIKEQGYDRETYAHYLRKARACAPRKASRKQLDLDRSTYLLFLEGHLDTAYQVQKYACLTRTPPVNMARTDDGDDPEPKPVVTLRAREMATLREKLEREAPQKELRVIRLSIAEKDLSPVSIAPALGIDTTLPHLRPAATAPPLPAQDEYPVWYFFYGTLAEPARLVDHLSLSEDPVLKPASVKGGKIKMWGKYRALVDADLDDVVSGHAYEVLCEEHEQRLRAYETSKYEVVRCKIRLEESGKETWGLTFRFCGDDLLSE